MALDLLVRAGLKIGGKVVGALAKEASQALSDPNTAVEVMDTLGLGIEDYSVVSDILEGGATVLEFTGDIIDTASNFV